MGARIRGGKKKKGSIILVVIVRRRSCVPADSGSTEISERSARASADIVATTNSTRSPTETLMLKAILFWIVIFLIGVKWM